jgi:two-component system sensor histidine kinase TctE
MNRLFSQSGSLQQRLIWQLLAVAAVLATLLYISIRSVANTAVETSQDSILGAATLAIAEQMRGGQDGIDIDIPYSAFSMLGAMGDDRIFYRILVDGQTVTGYETLPVPGKGSGGLTPTFSTREFQDTSVRIASVERAILVDGRTVSVRVLVAQTRSAKDAIVARLANQAALLGLGFFLLASVLSILTARSVLKPVNRLTEAVGRRGPQDLRPVDRPVPTELVPLVSALNGFISRLSGALARTETFIAEAAHHIRTPLTTLRAQSELALHQAEDAELKDRLRKIIRLVDDSARSAGQLLDHAAVIYRTDQRADEVIELNSLVGDVVDTFRPTAELRDITITVAGSETPVAISADRLLIESALRNVIDNAIKYSEIDGHIEVLISREGQSVEMSVLDSGRGLNGVTESALAARFRRGSNVGDVVGTGLGLTIVREVARAHGGEFRLTQRKEGGACARLSLPSA